MKPNAPHFVPNRCWARLRTKPDMERQGVSQPWRSSSTFRASLLWGAALVACDPFPLSQPDPIPDRAEAVSYNVVEGKLQVLPAASSGKWSVVDEGLHFEEWACSNDKKLCVVGSVLR